MNALIYHNFCIVITHNTDPLSYYWVRYLKILVFLWNKLKFMIFSCTSANMPKYYWAVISWLTLCTYAYVIYFFIIFRWYNKRDDFVICMLLNLPIKPYEITWKRYCQSFFIYSSWSTKNITVKLSNKITITF